MESNSLQFCAIEAKGCGAPKMEDMWGEKHAVLLFTNG